MQTHSTPTAASLPAATRKDWVGLVVLSIACMLYSMDLAVLFLANPLILAELHPSPTQLLWMNDIYGFMVAGFLVTMGTLGDLAGRVCLRHFASERRVQEGKGKRPPYLFFPFPFSFLFPFGHTNQIDDAPISIGEYASVCQSSRMYVGECR